MARPFSVIDPAAPDDNAPRQSPDPTGRSLPPRTPYEDAVVGILAEILGRTDIDVNDRLLDLGDVSAAPRVVAQIRRTVGVDIPVADYIESGTVTGLAAVVAAKSYAARSTARPHAIGPRPPDARPVLSYDQQRLWMENQLLPGVIYNVHGRRRITGPLDLTVVEASIRAIVARHETLRTRFPATTGEPVQVVDDPDNSWRIPICDLSSLRERDGAEAVDREARRLLDEELTTPFDLTTGPLIRCLLVRISDTEHCLGVTMHHIVSDAWSIGLFIRELTALYQAGGDPSRAGLTPPPVQYRDYAVWQRGWLVDDALERQLSHWRRHLRGAPRVLALPTVQRRTNAMRAAAGQVLSALTPVETAALHQLCRDHGVTTFMVLYAVLATIFSRWSGQTDIVIGVPVAGRTNMLTDRLIGFFVNMLPLRVDLSGDPSFEALLQRVRRVALDGYAHAEAPMDELVRDLEISRDPRRTPLFEVVLNVVGSPEAEQVARLAIETMDTPSLFSRYDLTFTAQESGGVLRFKLDFPADRCDPVVGTELLHQLRTLLRAAVADPTVRLLDEPAGEPEPAAEQAPAGYPAVACHPAGPGAVAVVDGAGPVGYEWLAGAAGRVAALLAERGVPGADTVGVVRRPTAGFVATLVGVARAGLAGTVIETDDPALTGPLGLSTVLDPAPTGQPATGTVDLGPVLAPRDSESGTGTAGDATVDNDTDGDAPPDWAAGRYGLDATDRYVVLAARPGLLMSAVRTAFGAGATLAIPDRAFGDDVAALTDWLRDNAITVAYLDASLLRALTTATPLPVLPALRVAFLDNGGDLLPHDIEALRELAPGCRCVTLYRVQPDGRPLAAYDVPADLAVRDAPLRIPLGTPVPGMGVTLLRPSGAPAAAGELAEIWQGGQRTGDLGRRRPDGCLEYAGPADAPPGFDPWEVVAALRDVPGVRDAVVTEQATDDGGRALLGYVAGPDPQAGTVTIHNHVKARLPDYLVPRHVFVLPALPRTPWGGYDLRALPRPAGDAGDHDTYAAPRTPIERQLTELLAELLGIDRVGIYDSFFELGGFSMLATRLIARVRDGFGVQLAVRDVFESPTVDELAQLIVRAQVEQVGANDLEALLAEIEQTAG